jgi:AraC-like DNA-binding protein
MGTLDDMRAIVASLLPQDGRWQTPLPFLSLLRHSNPTSLQRGVLKPSCCFILQGQKQVHLAQDVLDYGAGEYLVVTLELAAAGHVVTATSARPYLLLNIELDPAEIAAVVAEAGIGLSMPAQPVRGAYIGKADPELLDALYKLLRLLQAPTQEAAFLAAGVKREILYRLLTGEYGPQLYRNVVLDQHDQGIGKAISWLKANFDRSIKVEELAQASNMSVSSLHHRFKAVTTMGPLQYQKQLRLQQARSLLLGGGVDATTAAYKVGYESQSQFSREYRRLFGAPPMQDVRQWRAAMQDQANIVQDTP